MFLKACSGEMLQIYQKLLCNSVISKKIHSTFTVIQFYKSAPPENHYIFTKLLSIINSRVRHKSPQSDLSPNMKPKSQVNATPLPLPLPPLPRNPS